MRYPVAGGHEGAGVVEEVGGVGRLEHGGERGRRPVGRHGRDLRNRRRGINAVQGAATAQELVTELTGGVGADQALVTVGVVTDEVMESAFAAARKRGTVVVTGLATKCAFLPA